MTEDEIQTRQLLKDNFIHYASRCLKIRTKQGEIAPFILNKAQEYIHQKLEEQRLQTGKVRALILKGRQQGCCFSPDMRILTSDYRWVPIGSINVGDKLVSCDENSVGFTKIGRKQSRKFRTSTVEAKAIFYKPTYEVLFDNGARLNVTAEHRMLSKQRGGCEQRWRLVADFKVGDYIRIATRPPNYKSSYEDGWMGGLIDGEGSMRGKNGGTKRVSIHQIAGPILDRIKAYFKNIDMPYCEVLDRRTSGVSSKLGDKPVHRLDIHRLPYIIELFSRCRPTRFTNDEWHLGHELPGKAATDGIKPWAKIIKITPLKKQKVIDLQTSEKTYMCEGLVSHNSTYVGGRFYHKTTHNKGTQCFILTHALDATNNLFKMAQRFYQNTPNLVQPDISTNNSKELIFGRLDSGYKLGTAENKAVGRSSTIQLFHGSEIAFWANAQEHTKGILQAVPDATGTEIILESTANGVGNYFHQMWQKAESGQSDFIAIFVPWFWQDEYKRAVPPDFQLNHHEVRLRENYGLAPEQLAWRRYKIVDLSINGQDGEKSFSQEYPCNPTDAFILKGENSFIESAIVVRARKTTTEKHGAITMGVDPARFGDDRTSIILRQGRVAFGLASYTKKDTMEVTGIVHMLIEQHRPLKVFVDVGGLGAGVVDRLNELGHRDIVVAVNAGSKSLDEKKYSNKRAEMWGKCAEWLNDIPVQIPDSDSLHADLCGIRYSFDSNSRLVMERKEDIKKRGIRSSDEADALCLTFALPTTAYKEQPNPSAPILKSLAQDFNNKLAAIRKSRS